MKASAYEKHHARDDVDLSKSFRDGDCNEETRCDIDRRPVHFAR